MVADPAGSTIAAWRGEAAEADLAKAEESLASAESDFAPGRFNVCANRAYYARFRAAIAASLREGMRSGGRDGQWGHMFVESRFVGHLVNRRHRYPSALRRVLAENRPLRQKADYEPDDVTRSQAERVLRRARGFVLTVRASGGERR